MAKAAKKPAAKKPAAKKPAVKKPAVKKNRDRSSTDFVEYNDLEKTGQAWERGEAVECSPDESETGQD